MTAEPADAPQSRRGSLSREKVLRAAVAMADEGGGVPSTRRLAERLGVRAMALYHHFRDKDELLGGMVDLVYAEVELPSEGMDWPTAMRRRAVSMREALIRHRWAIGLMDSGSAPGDAILHHHDAVIGCLRGAGFSIAGAAHAFSMIDSYIYGFVLQELSLPFNSPAELDDVAASMMENMPRERFPHLAEMIGDHALKPGYSYAEEFDIGLDLILDGLQRHRERWR